MRRINFTIKGISPILFNAWTDSAREKLDKGSTGGKMSVDERIEEATNKVYRNGDGELCIPDGNVEACLEMGARKAGLKRGRAGLAPYLKATVFCEGPLSLGRKDPDGIHEVMGKRGGNAVIIRRPILNEWEASGTFLVADERMDVAQIKQALEEAGLLAGLCDWRPKYGRFLVTAFDVAA